MSVSVAMMTKMREERRILHSKGRSNNELAKVALELSANAVHSSKQNPC